MRVNEAIDRADRLRPNAVNYFDKRLSLYRLEMEIAEMMELEEMPEWEDAEGDYELLVPDPHSEVYPLHLLAYIDHVQEETDLYQIDMITANQALAEVKAWWRRNNKEQKDIRFRRVFI